MPGYIGGGVNMTIRKCADGVRSGNDRGNIRNTDVVGKGCSIHDRACIVLHVNRKGIRPGRDQTTWRSPAKCSGNIIFPLQD